MARIRSTSLEFRRSAILICVPHIIEPASSGRSKCRGCAKPIASGTFRFGERLPNPFADGEMILWFHPACAAYKRPEPFLQTLGEMIEAIPDRERLERIAQQNLTQRRLPRIDGAERSPGRMAKCRHCRTPIERGAWRIRLVFYEEGMFTPGGFLHLSCRNDYFEAHDVMDQVLHFSSDLSDDERTELRRASDSDSRP
jgi:hypothetical protein